MLKFDTIRGLTGLESSTSASRSYKAILLSSFQIIRKPIEPEPQRTKNYSIGFGRNSGKVVLGRGQID